MFSEVRRHLLQLMLLFAASFMVQADEAPPMPPDQLQWQFSLALGYGQYGSMLFDHKDSTLAVLPRWSVYYQRFYLENLDLGFNLIETEHFSVDLSTKQNFDALSVRDQHAEDALIKSLSFNEIALPILWNEPIEDVLNLQKRHLSYLGGMTAFARMDNLELRSEWHHDISGVHHGHEWNTLLRAQYQLGSLEIAPTLGLRRLDNKLANYYFGLSYHETTDLLSVLPGAMWLPSVKLDSSWQISQDLRVIVSLKREFYPSKEIGRAHV